MLCIITKSVNQWMSTEIVGLLPLLQVCRFNRLCHQCFQHIHIIHAYSDSMESLYHIHDQSLHGFHLQNGINSQLTNQDHVKQSSLCDCWHKATRITWKQKVSRVWCPGPASRVVQVIAAVWGRDQYPPTSETWMISVRLKYFWANFVKAAKGGERRI